jgi:predicted TIM-barrel fold metal-dependent hydrolase
VIDLAQQISGLRLIDNHVHGFWTDCDRTRFENGLNEANTAPLAAFDSGFDTQLGFAVRAHCAALLDLPAHTDPDSYWNRRVSHTEYELAQRFLPAAGVSDWLVDTGVPGVANLTVITEVSGSRVREIVRLEQVAEQAAATAGDYVTNFRGILADRAANAVATKTVLAYRGGLDGDLSEPSPREVVEAAERWRHDGRTRLTDRVLLRFGLHEALRIGKPLQFHIGLGDRDCNLNRTNPLALLDFLRHCGDIPIVLLHCYPYEREAGYLAQAFNNVYLDVGLSVNHLGARAAAFLGRCLELAPFRKILYSSDAYGPPELHYLGARLWRLGMTEVLAEFVARGHWSTDDAVRVATLIGRDNAVRLYRL